MGAVADQKQDGARQSARSSTSTYIRTCVHGQMYLFRFVCRCTVRAVHKHTHTRGSESMRIRSVSTKSRCREHMNFTLLRRGPSAIGHGPSRSIAGPVIKPQQIVPSSSHYSTASKASDSHGCQAAPLSSIFLEPLSREWFCIDADEHTN